MRAVHDPLGIMLQHGVENDTKAVEKVNQRVVRVTGRQTESEAVSSRMGMQEPSHSESR